MLIDSHTHSSFSFDSQEPLINMVDRAKALGMSYMAVTEHWDNDYLAEGYDYEPLMLDDYIAEALAIKKQEKDLYLAVGVECGYSSLAIPTYAESIPKYPFEVIINSVHLVDGIDVYKPIYYVGKDKNTAYVDYFKVVRESLEVPYRYDVIGHIGFAMRYLPQEDKSLTPDAKAIVEDIFKRAIELDKTIEVNVHVRETGLQHVPTREMLKLYRDLGGDNLTFSTDAHQTARLGERWQTAKQNLLDLGYKYLTIYKEGQAERVKID